MGKTTKLYKGKIELVFDAEDHKYTIDGRWIPSVTSINGVESNPALGYWRLNEGLEYINQNLKPGEMIDEVSKAKLVRGVKYAAANNLNTYADIGSFAHNFAEEVIKYKLGRAEKPDWPINEEVKQASKAFIDWTKQHDVEFHDTEFQVYSKKHDYCGTVDIDATVDGERCICDLKTGKGIYANYCQQLAAYRVAHKEESGLDWKAGWIIRINKQTGQFKAERLEPEVMEACFDTFLKWRAAYDSRRNRDDVLDAAGVVKKWGRRR